MESKNNGPVEIVLDPSTGKEYIKGQFLGKGGFAKCYELTDKLTNKIYAGKIVSKSLLVKPHQKEKMTQEIKIHKSLNHKYIVGFKGFFEDDDNVYILLELCERKSLMELHKRRKVITEPEARYFTYQIAKACEHLHSNKIIHRDLKLGNLFLNSTMEVKVGDFGLATKLEFEGERKKTLCGTPNYLAPEVLSKTGHSYQVDAWSLGCILYTFLFGRPPFETSNLKDTYSRIKNNEYQIPTGKASHQARSLIERLLHADPSQRPSMSQVLQDEFLRSGYLPKTLPVSCLSMTPNFSAMRSHAPLVALAEQNANAEVVQKIKTETVQPEIQKPTVDDPLTYLRDLHRQLVNLITALSKLNPTEIERDEVEDPVAAPVFWISRWVDYSDKYGLGYQLCDESMGVYFNDGSKLLHAEGGELLQYITKNEEKFYPVNSYPQELEKKKILLKYFHGYMGNHLSMAGGAVNPPGNMTRLPHMVQWRRSSRAIYFLLSNGTVQVNFAETHRTKLVMCPIMEAVTRIQAGPGRTFKFSLLEKHGCSHEFLEHLTYAKYAVGKLLAQLSC